MDFTEEVIHFFNFIGSLVCHQRLERTLIIGGRPLPVCARDTGIYLGLLIGYIILLFRKKDARGPPDLYATLALSMPLLIDAMTQIVGIRDSTNSLRLITGLFFGVALLPLLLYSIQLLPAMRCLPFLSHLSIKKPRLDDIKNSWVSAKALLLGAVLSLVLFIALNIITNSSNAVLYWIVAPPIIFSIIVHFFVLLPLIIFYLIYDLLKSYLDKHRKWRA